MFSFALLFKNIAKAFNIFWSVLYYLIQFSIHLVAVVKCCTLSQFLRDLRNKKGKHHDIEQSAYRRASPTRQRHHSFPISSTGESI